MIWDVLGVHSDHSIQILTCFWISIGVQRIDPEIVDFAADISFHFGWTKILFVEQRLVLGWSFRCDKIHVNQWFVDQKAVLNCSCRCDQIRNNYFFEFSLTLLSCSRATSTNRPLFLQVWTLLYYVSHISMLNIPLPASGLESSAWGWFVVQLSLTNRTTKCYKPEKDRFVEQNLVLSCSFRHDKHINSMNLAIFLDR